MANEMGPWRPSAVIRVALRACDRFIPDSSRLDVEALRQRRLLVMSTWLLAFFAFVLGTEQARSDGSFLGIPVLTMYAGGTLALINGVIGQRRWPERTNLALVLILFVTLMALAVESEGGYWDASIWWQLTIPLLATFLVSARAGAAFAGLIILEVVLLYLVDPEPTLPDDAAHFLVISQSTAVFAITALAFTFELSRSAAQERVGLTLEELQQANEQLEGLASALASAKEEAEHDSQVKTELIIRMRETARVQREAIDETSGAMAGMTATFRTVAESVGTLAQAAAESGGAVAHINNESETAAAQLSEMVDAVEQSAGSLEEMSLSVREVAANVSRLSDIADDTSSAMNQMLATITQVEERARSTERLANAVKGDAEKGAEAVGYTRDGIQDILSISRMAGETIRTLGERIKAIDHILHVINEVAAQTQLLSLNAAIIASQAGEQGRGFSVVASEIKMLAERTSRSTKDIAAVIRGVQEESQRAVRAINEGESAVLVGLERSHDAEQALRKIVTSADETNDMVSSIVAVTGQQADAARDVGRAMEQVALAASGVASATREQARGAELLEEVTSRLRRLARAVEKAGGEQREGARQVQVAVEQVRRMVLQLHSVQDNQARGGEQIHVALEAIGRTQASQLEAIDTLDKGREQE